MLRELGRKLPRIVYGAVLMAAGDCLLFASRHCCQAVKSGGRLVKAHAGEFGSFRGGMRSDGPSTRFILASTSARRFRSPPGTSAAAQPR